MESPMAEALRVSDADLLVYVHPSNANRIQKALCRQLSVALFARELRGLSLYLGRDHQVRGDKSRIDFLSPDVRRFNETFDGVLLAYSFGLPSKTARILPGLIPYLCVNVKAKLLLFSPRQDMLLEGKVVKLNKETIYVVVLGFCAAAITSENIREEFRYKIKGGHGMFSSTAHKRHVIKPGTILRFLVKSFDEEILHISGSLIPAHTGCLRWLSKHGTAEDSEFDGSEKSCRGDGDISRDEGNGLLNECDATALRSKSRRTT